MTEKALLLENRETGQRAVPTLLVGPEKLALLASGLSRKVLASLAKKPACAMDVAKELGEHEQKIYYHVRRLSGAGLIRQIKQEKRLGMTANIYEIMAPSMTAKLSEGVEETVEIPVFRRVEAAKLLHPFVKNGKLNSLVILGEPYPHGKFDTGGLDGCYVADIAMLLGNVLHGVGFPMYRLDTRVHRNDLRENNLIVIGNPRGNSVAYQLLEHLPVTFDEQNNWALVSKRTGRVYRDDQAGLIAKMRSPFNPEKMVLLLAGSRTRGTEAAVIGFTRFYKDLLSTAESNDVGFVRIVHGIDQDSDGVMDTVKFLE